MTIMYFLLGLIFLGFIFQIAGAFKLDGSLMLDCFLLQAMAVLLAIPFISA